MHGFSKDLDLACECGGKFMGAGNYKTTNPMFTGCKCDRCGVARQAYLDSNNVHHLTRHEAVAADQAKLAAITHCMCCGRPVNEADCATSGADVKVCRSCCDAARDKNLMVRAVARDPSLIGVARLR